MLVQRTCQYQVVCIQGPGLQSGIVQVLLAPGVVDLDSVGGPFNFFYMSIQAHIQLPCQPLPKPLEAIGEAPRPTVELADQRYFLDQHRHKDLTLVDDPECLYAEWARHAAWRARNRLDNLITELTFTPDRKAVATALEDAVKDVSAAIEEMRDNKEHSMHHYEKNNQ